ncbi:hypothetical protein J6590_060674 [Homalodisca vitripennis]|nr:hypothetical protein J6590_060674 [Homalodisca vitripennis]
MSEGKQLSKTNKHLIKQNIKLELLLTCTPRLGVLTPLSRKGQTPSNAIKYVYKMKTTTAHYSPLVQLENSEERAGSMKAREVHVTLTSHVTIPPPHEPPPI